MQDKQELKGLKHGSLEKIYEAFNKGAGIFFRSDVEILIEKIREVESHLDIIVEE